MKKMLITLLGALTLVSVATAKDQPRKLNEMPATAQQFLQKHFADKQLSYATQDTDLFDGEYKVVFTNGDKVEFDRKGNWQEVECKRDPAGVPAAIIPAAIRNYLTSNFSNAKVKAIEFNKEIRKGYEVKLDNGLELEFSQSGEFIRLDE